MIIKRRKFDLLVGSALMFIGIGIYLAQEGFPLFYLNLDSFLRKELAMERPVSDCIQCSGSNGNRVIYVLGGSSEDRAQRFQKAADLYRPGTKILIDKDLREMEYSSLKKRNITENEWDVDTLTFLGVQKEDIEPVPIKSGFFGTYSEARTLTEQVASRGYQSLILVSSKYHTKRVWVSFLRLSQRYHLTLYIYPARDYSRIKALVIEFLKLKYYELFLV